MKNNTKKSLKLGNKCSTILKCVVCDSEFVPTYDGQKCCGGGCSHKKGAQTQNQVRKITIKCMVCGGEYQSRKPFGRNVRYQSRCPVCQLIHDRERSRKRRMKVKETKEKINDFDIFERDNWICQICGEAVDKEKRWPDPLSASIDHIKPIRFGGLHIPSNVRLAHHRCNNQKHDQYREGYRYETWTCT
jgi:5-methylcytosine-specific restriction endonuclease McrA